MSEDYELGDGPCHDRQDWIALLSFMAKNWYPTQAKPGTLAESLLTSEQQTRNAWIQHALIEAAHSGACGCIAARRPR